MGLVRGADDRPCLHAAARDAALLLSTQHTGSHTASQTSRAAHTKERVAPVGPRGRDSGVTCLRPPRTSIRENCLLLSNRTGDGVLSTDPFWPGQPRCLTQEKSTVARPRAAAFALSGGPQWQQEGITCPAGRDSRESEHARAMGRSSGVRLSVDDRLLARASSCTNMIPGESRGWTGGAGRGGRADVQQLELGPQGSWHSQGLAGPQDPATVE